MVSERRNLRGARHSQGRIRGGMETPTVTKAIIKPPDHSASRYQITFSPPASGPASFRKKGQFSLKNHVPSNAVPISLSNFARMLTHGIRRLQAMLLGHNVSPEKLYAELEASSIPVSTADCRTCQDPCDEGACSR